MGNEGHWGGEIFIVSQNFAKSSSIIFHPLGSSISQTSPKGFAHPPFLWGVKFQVLKKQPTVHTAFSLGFSALQRLLTHLEFFHTRHE
jgi:hypothetical protein